MKVESLVGYIFLIVVMFNLVFLSVILYVAYQFISKLWQENLIGDQKMLLSAAEAVKQYRILERRWILLEKAEQKLNDLVIALSLEAFKEYANETVNRVNNNA